jgi:hypothetical protein
MKSFFPVVLLAGGLLLANSGKKSSRKSSTTPKETPADKNNKAILEYYSKDPIKITMVNELMADLTEKIKDEVFEYRDQYILHLKPQYVMEAYLVAKDILMRDKKPVTNVKEADPITKEILENIAPDVFWGEGLAPYGFESPFNWVWKAVSLIVIVASKNLVDQGYIK